MRDSLRAMKVGLPPGTILALEDKDASSLAISLTSYDEKTLHTAVLDGGKLPDEIRTDTYNNWGDIVGQRSPELIDQLRDVFGISMLTLEDIETPHHRPKFEDCGGYCFCIVQMISQDQDNSAPISEQVGIIWTDDLVISFQQRQGDVFDGIRNRLAGNKGRIRRSQAPYLAYAMLDTIVDHYFVVLEGTLNSLSETETAIANDTKFDPRPYLSIARQIVRSVSTASVPLREAVRAMRKAETSYVPDSLQEFLRDLDDHIAEIMDLVEVARVRNGELMEQYQTNISNEMNAIMKVLTIVSTVFIPLTFIAGIYGMNFVHMPELGHKLAYPVALGAMLAMGLLMLLGFKLKKWL